MMTDREYADYVERLRSLQSVECYDSWPEELRQNIELRIRAFSGDNKALIDLSERLSLFY